MNDRDSETVGPMLNPPHLGELIRESMEASHWNVTETAARWAASAGRYRVCSMGGLACPLIWR